MEEKEIIKCEECGEVFDNKKIKANHVRWKHRDNTDYKKKISLINKKSYANKHGNIIKETVNCNICEKEIDIEYREGKKKDKYFCSRSCANTRKHSDETKMKMSNIIKEKLDNGIQIGFCLPTKEEIDKICLHCEKRFLTKDNNKKCCSRKCSTRYRNKDKDLKKLYRFINF